MAIDQILNFEGKLPQEIIIENKKDLNLLDLINQLEEEDNCRCHFQKLLIQCSPKRNLKISFKKTSLP